VRRLLVLSLVTLVLLASMSIRADAQSRPVQFEGFVQWISGQSMLVLLDSGLSINVNLIRVPQWHYLALLPGERILVNGTLPAGSRTVSGVSIVRLSSSEAP
jgi:hypothetical protein